MKRDYKLTSETVAIYQKIYYFHYKPLMKHGLTECQVRHKLQGILNQCGWDWATFEDFKSIDFMQRLVFEYSHELVISGSRREPMTSRPEYRQYDPNFGALRLKNNELSEDPDRLQ